MLDIRLGFPLVRLLSFVGAELQISIARTDVLKMIIVFSLPNTELSKRKIAVVSLA